MIVTVLAWVASAIGGILALVLVVPLRIRIEGWLDAPRHADFSLAADWATGLIGVEKDAGQPWRLRVMGWRILQFSPSRRKKKEKKKKDAGKKSPMAMAGVAKNHFHTLLEILGRLIKSLFPEGYIIGRVGLADPADTAKMALALRMFPAAGKRFEMSVTPVYDEEVIQLEARARVTIVLVYIGVTALWLLLQKPTRMMLRSLRHA